MTRKMETMSLFTTIISINKSHISIEVNCEIVFLTGSPVFPTPPQSPSCSSASNMGYFVFPCTTTVNSSPRSSRIYIDGPYSRESPRNSFAVR